MFDQNNTMNLTCTVCGGTDFHVEVGFYYCNECQTQSQEVREQCFDFHETVVATQVTSKVISRKKTASERELRSAITSWKGYNYIMAGLVNEMIELGVDKSYKDVMFGLWHMYWKKLEVIPKECLGKSKLGIVYHQKDAAIVFNRNEPKKKHRKKNSNMKNYSEDWIKKKENMRLKRDLISAEFKSSGTQSSTLSVSMQTLSSLSTKDSSDDDAGEIRFSKIAKKELRKKMATNHISKHEKDVLNKLKCHKFKTRTLSKSFSLSGKCTTRSVLYALLYVGLLVIEDDIQLSDLLRYCREGHISFLSYSHFFPEEFTEKQINEILFQKGQKIIPSHKLIRTIACNICTLLNLQPCNFCPDLLSLVERYCKELNLPDEVKNMTVNLILLTKPKVITKKSTFPNYEGRAMAFIIYILKFLYGLDSATEYEISHFAEQLNSISSISKVQRMFDWKQWMNYIEYRKVILKRNYFPIKYLLEPNDNQDISSFTKFIEQQNTFENDTNVLMSVLKKILKDIELFQNSSEENIKFKPTLTPFHDYTKILQDKLNIETNILQDFSAFAVNFITNPKKYFEILNVDDYKIFHKSANTNSQLVIMNKSDYSAEELLSLNKQYKKLMLDEASVDILSNELIKDKLNPQFQIVISEATKFVNKKQKKIKVARNSKGQFCSLKSEDKKNLDSFTPQKRRKWFISQWTHNPELDIANYNYLFKKFGDESITNIVKSCVHKKTDDKNAENRFVCFKPQLGSWVLVSEVDKLKNNEWNKFFKTLPSTFQWLLEECSLIIEQSSKDLFAEFVCVELYVNYVYLNNVPKKLDNGYDNHINLSKLINKMKNRW